MHQFLSYIFYFHYMSLILCFVFTYLFGSFRNSQNNYYKKAYLIIPIVLSVSILLNIIEYGLLIYLAVVKYNSLVADGYLFTTLSLTLVELIFIINFFVYKGLFRTILSFFSKKG
jgi:hypothetical protein